MFATNETEARLRALALWICVGLFFLRVVGQIEVLLLSPMWLPPMEDWYSGLIPYPLLLPLQIAILMLMAVVTAHATLRPVAAAGGGRWAARVRAFALVYFSIMAVRLVISLLRGDGGVIAAGGIPIAFHWVLALYLMMLCRARSA